MNNPEYLIAAIIGLILGLLNIVVNLITSVFWADDLLLCVFLPFLSIVWGIQTYKNLN